MDSPETTPPDGPGPRAGTERPVVASTESGPGPEAGSDLGAGADSVGASGSGGTPDPDAAGVDGTKLAIEHGPLIALVVAYAAGRIWLDDQQALIWATGVFMAATAVSIVASLRTTGRVAPMTLVTAAVVAVLGGLTVYLNDETFIKRKPTLVFGVIGAVLLGGLAVGRPLVKQLLSQAVQLDETGWRKLTLRWGLFFLGLGALNEVLWRHMSTGAWLTFKTLGVLVLTGVFFLTQFPMIQRHLLEEETDAAGESPDR